MGRKDQISHNERFFGFASKKVEVHLHEGGEGERDAFGGWQFVAVKTHVHSHQIETLAVRQVHVLLVVQTLYKLALKR